MKVVCCGLVAAIVLFGFGISEAQESCGLAKDLMVRALERIHPGGPAAELDEALQLLKHATEQCSSLGDAWYYRSVVEKQLGHSSQAAYALGKARLFGSEELQQNSNPFVLATEPKAAPGPPGPVHDKWALVVGIGKFHDPNLNLQYTTKDARDFAAIVSDSNYGRFNKDHVRVLLDQEATTRRIKSELNALARNAGPDDMVVIYLASHGSPRESDIGGVNYVITADTDVSDPDSLYATALPMVELTNVIRNRVKARRAVVFLDTCHSGGALPNGTRGVTLVSGVTASSASQETLDDLRQGEGRVIIASSQASESSYESPKLHNGYFTYFLIRALMQDQGHDPIEKLYSFIKDQVSTKVQADLHARQTPVISRSDQATDIVIGTAVPGSTATGSGN